MGESRPESIHLNRDELTRWQLEKIRTLLSAIMPDNAFYANKLKATGASDAASLEEFSERVPFTSKEELVQDQSEHPPFGTNLTYPLHRYTRFHQTSATTGTPLRWLDTPESWNWMLNNWKRVYGAAGVRREDRICFAFSFGPFLGFWAGFEAAAELGCLRLPAGGMRSSARLKMILDQEVTVLCCTPTYAIRLGELAREEKINQLKVRLIIVAGEIGASIPATRAHIEGLWSGARLVDHHGMTEVGPVSYECPQQPCVLHIIEPAFYPEVVDPQNGAPVPEGQVGELVLTNLERTGSPLLRYRTGDLVRWERPGPCGCGSYELALRSGILGRSDDAVVVRGVNVYPSAVEEVVRSVGGVAEYRVQVLSKRAMRELEVQIEAGPGIQDTEVAERLQAALQTALSLRIPVSTLPPGSLPRFEFKAMRWIWQ